MGDAAHSDPFSLGATAWPLQRVLGVDPGSHGALALLELGRGYAYLGGHDMPIRDRGKKTTNNTPDGKALRKIILEWKPTIAVMEDVQPMPDRIGGRDDSLCPGCGRSKSAMPPKHAFTFGEMCGGVRTALEALEVDVVMVTSQAWKRAAGLGARGERTRTEVKAESLALARTLWPDAPLKLARSEALAEAMLIAKFGLSSQMNFF